MDEHSASESKEDVVKLPIAVQFVSVTKQGHARSGGSEADGALSHAQERRSLERQKSHGTEMHSEESLRLSE